MGEEIGSVARAAVVSGTATAVSGRVAGRQQAKFAQQAAQVAAQREVYAEQAEDFEAKKKQLPGT